MVKRGMLATAVLMLSLAAAFVPTNVANAQEVRIDGGDCSKTFTSDCGNGVRWEVFDTDADGSADKMVISGEGMMEPFPYFIDENGTMNIFGKTYTPWLNYVKTIKTIVVEDGVENIDLYNYFENANTLILADSVTCIDSARCGQLRQLDLPDGVTEIKRTSFDECPIESLTLPNSVVFIGYHAFAKASGELYIPESVKKIDAHAFNPDLIDSVEVSEGNSVYDSRNNCNAIMESGTDRLIFASRNAVIPNTTKIIGEGAFGDAPEHIVLPEGVEIIESGAFSDCTSLIDIVFPSSLVEINGVQFYTHYSLRDITVLSDDVKLDDFIPAFFSSRDQKVNIHGHVGSTIQEYCESHGLNFIAIGESGVQEDTQKNGLHQADDGNWYLYESGNVNASYNGLYYDEVAGWWLVQGGAVAFDYSDLYCDSVYGWWKVTGGAVDFDYTGLYESPTCGWWLIGGGSVVFDYTDLWGDPIYGWWKVTGGTVDFDYTGLYESQTCGWWLVGGGLVAFDYTDLWGDPIYGWWKVTGGTVDFGYTDLYESSTCGWWLVNGGMVDFWYTGQYDSPQYGSWNVNGGAVVF